MPSVHPLHRAANLTDHTRSCRSRTRTYTSPTRRALLGVASWSASARAHRFRQPGDAVLAWPASRTAAEARAVISPSAIINLPIPGHTYTHTTRARMGCAAPDWLAGRPRVCTGWQSPPTSLRSKNKPTRPSLTGAFAKVGSPHPHLHQDRAHSCRICAGTRDRAAPSPTGAFADM